jgi:type I restriction enzyme S subunit
MNAMARIADLAEQIRGVSYDKEDASSTPRPGFLPILRAGNITDEGIVFEDLVFVPADRISEKQKIRKNDVIIAASSGSLDVVGKAARALQDFDGGFGAFCKVLRPGPDIDPSYFAHFFRTPEYRRRVSSLAAGVSINNLKNEHLDEILIPLPPLPEQRRIAAILDKADELRAKRRAALKKLDELTQSIFLDMFGDPATNPKGWPVFPLADLCCIAGEYGAGVASKPYDPELPRYIRITDITDSGDLTPDAVSPAGDASEWAAYSLEPGDVLFARSGATVGKTYLHRQSYGRSVFAGYLIRFRVRPDRILPEYLFHFTRTSAYRRWVAARQRVVAQPNINAQQYGQELYIPCPPLELQARFKDQLNHIDRVRTEYHTALIDTDALFASLQHRAFRGEL